MEEGDLKKRIGELDDERARLLQSLCEDESIWHPELIVRIVHSIRTITRIIRILKGEEERFK